VKDLRYPNPQQLPWLGATVRDMRIAVRSLRRTPGFTLTAIATLAIGIGVNAAVFTVTNAVLFKGFRLVERNDRILYVDTREHGRGCCVSYPDFEDWRAQATSFEDIGTAADLGIPSATIMPLRTATPRAGSLPMLSRCPLAWGTSGLAPPRFVSIWLCKSAQKPGREPSITIPASLCSGR
jgi:hypothetical protein